MFCPVTNIGSWAPQ